MRWRRSSAALLVLSLLAGCGGSSSEASPKVVVPAIVRSTPVVPVIDAEMKERLRAIFLDGQARGMQAGVFAKVGDSNTALADFLVPIGCGDVVYGRWEALLRPVVERWSATPVPRGWELPEFRCEVSNSFTRIGSAAFSGWRTRDMLEAHRPQPAECRPPHDIAIRCELFQLRPAVALVMIGTNDMLLDDQSIDPSGLEHFGPQLRRLLEVIVDAGVIPVVSTLPPRRHPGPEAEPLPPIWNAEVIRVARSMQLPVWNYWLDLQSSSQHGLSYDLLHPSPAPTGAGDLRDPAMDWGFNVRNLGALRVLEKLGRIVLDDGVPDSP